MQPRERGEVAAAQARDRNAMERYLAQATLRLLEGMDRSARESRQKTSRRRSTRDRRRIGTPLVTLRGPAVDSAGLAREVAAARSQAQTSSRPSQSPPSPHQADDGPQCSASVTHKRGALEDSAPARTAAPGPRLAATQHEGVSLVTAAPPLTRTAVPKLSAFDASRFQAALARLASERPAAFHREDLRGWPASGRVATPVETQQVLTPDSPRSQFMASTLPVRGGEGAVPAPAGSEGGGGGLEALRASGPMVVVSPTDWGTGVGPPPATCAHSPPRPSRTHRPPSRGIRSSTAASWASLTGVHPSSGGGGDSRPGVPASRRAPQTATERLSLQQGRGAAALRRSHPAVDSTRRDAFLRRGSGW